MSERRYGRLASVVLLMLAGAIAAQGDLPAAATQAGDEWVCGAYDQSLKRGVEPAPDGLRNTYPVVTIHGITGSDQNFEDGIDLSYRGYEVNPPRSLMDLFAGAKGDAELPTPLPGAHVYSFSYTPDSLRWVDDDRVGGAFAGTVDCLYDVHGVPLVVVAHSMGGLVARWAANSVDDDGNRRAHKIGKVVTLGTPFNGSFVAEAVSGAGEAAGGAARSLPGTSAAAMRMIESMVSRCGESGTETGDGSCWGAGTLASEAGQNLRRGSAALDDLQRWPGTEAFAIAGEIRVQTYLFQAEALTVELGDGIVSADSATDDAQASRTFVCEYDLGNERERLWRWLTFSYGPDERSSEFTGLFGTPCYHSNLLRNVEVSNEVLGQVADWIDGQRAHEWTLAPGRIGPLYVGMSADEAIATGFVEQVPPDANCGTPYQATAPAGVGMLTDFRFGDPERLGHILVQGTTPRTAEGVGVGTPIDRLPEVYADRLIEVDPAPEWLVEHVFVVLGSHGAMVLMSYDGEAVTSVSLVPGATPEEAAGHLVFGC